MKLYLSIIATAMAAVAGANILAGTGPWYTVVAEVAACTAAQFALGGAVALIVNRLPDRLFGEDVAFYQVSEREKALYKWLKVRRWKDRVWDLGSLGGFSKKTLADPGSPEYIERFLLESNKGVLTHRLSYPVGFLVMLFLPPLRAFTLGLPIAAVALVLNILPTLSLRYSTPKLRLVLQRMRRKAAKS